MLHLAQPLNFEAFMSDAKETSWISQAQIVLVALLCMKVECLLTASSRSYDKAKHTVSSHESYEVSQLFIAVVLQNRALELYRCCHPLNYRYEAVLVGLVLGSHARLVLGRERRPYRTKELAKATGRPVHKADEITSEATVRVQ